MAAIAAALIAAGVAAWGIQVTKGIQTDSDNTASRVSSAANKASSAAAKLQVDQNAGQFNFSSRIAFYSDFVSPAQETVRRLTYVVPEVAKSGFRGNLQLLVGEPLGQAGDATASIALVSNDETYAMTQRIQLNLRCGLTKMVKYRRNHLKAEHGKALANPRLRSAVNEQTRLANNEITAFGKYVRDTIVSVGLPTSPLAEPSGNSVDPQSNLPTDPIWQLGSKCSENPATKE